MKLAPGQSEQGACTAVGTALEAAGVAVRSVALEPADGQDSGRLRTAYVRLPPPPLPWKQHGNGGGGSGAGNSNGTQVTACALCSVGVWGLGYLPLCTDVCGAGRRQGGQAIGVG